MKIKNHPIFMEDWMLKLIQKKNTSELYNEEGSCVCTIRGSAALMAVVALVEEWNRHKLDHVKRFMDLKSSGELL
jgi:hypothetical protein